MEAHDLHAALDQPHRQRARSVVTQLGVTTGRVEH
jgi:hypothetical protein